MADEPRSGRPTSARADDNVKCVRKVLRSDPRLIIQQIADTLNTSTFMARGISTGDLQIRKVCAKLGVIRVRDDIRDSIKLTTIISPAARPSSSLRSLGSEQHPSDSSYNPDVASSDFFLFFHLKKEFKGKH